MTLSIVLSWILVFSVVFAADVCWAFYVSRVKDGSAIRSANWASVLFLFSGFATISFVTNYWLLIPAVAGAWAGTWVAVKLDTAWKSWELFWNDIFGNKSLL